MQTCEAWQKYQITKPEGRDWQANLESCPQALAAVAVRVTVMKKWRKRMCEAAIRGYIEATQRAAAIAAKVV